MPVLDGVDIPVNVEAHTLAAAVRLLEDQEPDKDVSLEELVEREEDIFNPGHVRRRVVTSFYQHPLPAPVSVELDEEVPLWQQQRVSLEPTTEAIMVDANLDRFEHLHDEDDNRDAAGRRRRGTAAGTRARRRPARSRRVMSALASHVVYRDKDGRSGIEYESVAIRTRAEAESVGVQYNPQRVTTFVMRRRRHMTGAHMSIYMTPGDWVTVRNLATNDEERACVREFRPFRRYKSQRVADTAVVDVTRVSNV